MERFVFVLAIAVAILFGLGAMFGGPNWSNFSIHVGDDDGGRGTAAIIATSPGSMPAEAFAGGDLRIRNVAAVVAIIPEDRQDYSVEIDNTAGVLPMPTVATDDGRVVIDGQLRGRVRGCGDAGSASVRGYGDGEFDAAELPRITIRTPRALQLDRSGAGSTDIGATQSLSLEVNGCSTTTVADVAGDLSMDIAGSGNVNTGAAQSLDADVAGSADVVTGAIASGAAIDLAGSGSVTMASLTGELNSDAAGSGVVTVRGGAITIASIDLAGSGDVSIAATVQDLNVSIVGSGSVDVTAPVVNIDAEIAGSGSVSAPAASGSVRQEVFGSGEVSVGQ
ncbi:GIN domain-containing protein [Candidatus Viadribacter manganicus]|nr:DUF2807 domain-containing protein [Candidatus Viadribacter manganicus]